MSEAASSYSISSHFIVHGKGLCLQKYSKKKPMEHSAPQDINNFYALPSNT